MISISINDIVALKGDSCTWRVTRTFPTIGHHVPMARIICESSPELQPKIVPLADLRTDHPGRSGVSSS
jgi:hypothetical protein